MRQLITTSGTDLVAFAITGILVLIISLVYVWWLERTSGRLSCPGLKSEDPNLGNLPEISKKGGLHHFLRGQHEKLGPIFSFFWGKDEAVSIASPALFRDASISMLFDRYIEQFEVFKPHSKVDNSFSLQSYSSSDVGPSLRKIYNLRYGFSSLDDYFSDLVDIGNELINKWQKMNKEEQIPLTQHMLVIAMKSVIRASFGKEYFKNNKEIIEFQESYNTCWDEMQERMSGNIPDACSEEENNFDEHLTLMRDKIKEMLYQQRSKKVKVEPQTVFEAMLEVTKYADDDHVIDNLITYLVGGFHTTGSLLSWAIYFLCLHPEVEDKLFKEIEEILGNEEITIDHCKKMKYMEMVINETLRCSLIVPFATECSNYDIRIGGHIIPKNTPIIAAVGVVSKDQNVWSLPSKFDPERFNCKKEELSDPLAFQPFGFAGERKCPLFRFALYDVFVYLSYIIRTFKVKLVEDQNISYSHRLITQFDEEVWITAALR